MWISSAKTSPERLGTAGGMMEGGRRSPTRSRPGKTASVEENITAKPRVKKLGVSPGAVKRSFWTRNSRPPMEM